jgi:sugar lactone lactonase YvrE
LSACDGTACNNNANNGNSQLPQRAAGKITTVREPTNGANGLAFNKDGELFFAEGGGKKITKRGRDGTITTVIDNHAGQPMLGPNDLIFDARGGIYITDPGPRPVVPGRATARSQDRTPRSRSRPPLRRVQGNLRRRQRD